MSLMLYFMVLSAIFACRAEVRFNFGMSTALLVLGTVAFINGK